MRNAIDTDASGIKGIYLRTIVAKLFGVLRQLIVLPLISPAELGLFRFLSTLAGYSKLLEFGVIAAMRIKVPTHMAAGDLKAATRLEQAAARQGLIGAVIFAPVAFSILCQTNLSWFEVIAYSSMCGFPLLVSVGASVLHARGRFATAARAQMVADVVGFALTVLGAIVWGLQGVILGFFASLAVNIACNGFDLLRFSPEPLEPNATSTGLESDDFWFGARNWVAGALITWTAGCDVFLLGLLMHGSAAVLGYYSFALLVSGVVVRDIQAFSTVKKRRLQLEFAKPDRDLIALAREFARTDAILATVLSLVVLQALPLIPLVFPKYGNLAASITLLVLGDAWSSARNYTGVLFAMKDQSLLRCGGAIVQSLVLTAGVILTAMFSLDVVYLAACRAMGAALATIIDLVAVTAPEGAIKTAMMQLGEIALITAPLVLLVTVHLFGFHPILAGAAVAIGGIGVLALVFRKDAREIFHLIALAIRS